jgi:hypothetical protein
MACIPEEVWAGVEWKPIDINFSLNFTMSNMLEYLINRKGVDGKANNDFKNMNTKAYPLFKEGHIQSLAYKRYDKYLLIKCKCDAEMKKVRIT